MISANLNRADLLGLAPTTLRNGRIRRYHGDNLAVPMSAFVAEDQERLRELYAFLQSLFATLQGNSPERAGALNRFLGDHSVDSLIVGVTAFGPASYEANPSPLLGKAIHDVRGGGLTPLLGQLQLWAFGGGDVSVLDALYFLTRDHLKIMRNALLGLDDAKRNEDLEIKVHRTDFIVEKWSGALLRADEREVRLEVFCPESVAISECCVEFGALDRILYNLLNNACRHTVTDWVHLVLFPIPEGEAENLRFVVSNAIGEDDQSRLNCTELTTLFREGVSSTGSGYGLNVAADFVANAFGLSTPEEAVQGRYIGADLAEGSFRVWFHWPIVPDIPVGGASSDQ